MDKILEILIKINDNLENSKSDKFFTRKEVAEHYNLSQKETIKLFTKILKQYVVDIGKEQRLAKSHIDELFTKGIVMK